MTFVLFFRVIFVSFENVEEYDLFCVFIVYVG